MRQNLNIYPAYKWRNIKQFNIKNRRYYFFNDILILKTLIQAY